jgi:hypothetical protein
LNFPKFPEISKQPNTSEEHSNLIDKIYKFHKTSKLLNRIQILTFGQNSGLNVAVVIHGMGIELFRVDELIDAPE